MPYGSKDRLDWHFIPKDHRKGLRVKNLTEEQSQAAHKLLQTGALRDGLQEDHANHGSGTRYSTNLKAAKAAGRESRIGTSSTIFGNPSDTSRWGLSFEGHHLSLNFVVDSGKVLSTTPQVFCTNPAEIKNENKQGFTVGTRVLKNEEVLAFELINGLPEAQQKEAILADKAPREVRDPGTPQPPTAAPEGLPAGKMSSQHQDLLRKLIDEYAQAMPALVAKERWGAINEAGFNNVHFAWAGPTKPGIGHYYRIQGPTFLVELVNTQPDAAGNPANHVHWSLARHARRFRDSD